MTFDAESYCETDAMLRLGIFQLLMRKYEPVLAESSKFLCAALVGWAMAEHASNPEGAEYMRQESIFIQQQARCMCTDSSLEFALSVLYGHTLAGMAFREPDRVMILADRAIELGISLDLAAPLFLSNEPSYAKRLLKQYCQELLDGKAV